MSFRLAAATAAAILSVSSSAGAQVLMQRDVSLRMALAIAETAIAACGLGGGMPINDARLVRREVAVACYYAAAAWRCCFRRKWPGFSSTPR
jgi:hypothetical protein